MNCGVMAKNVSFDLRVSHSNQYIFESKWTFMQNLKTFSLRSFSHCQHFRKDFSAAVFESCAPSEHGPQTEYNSLIWDAVVETCLCKMWAQQPTSKSPIDRSSWPNSDHLMLLEEKSHHFKVITIIFIRG